MNTIFEWGKTLHISGRRIWNTKPACYSIDS